MQLSSLSDKYPRERYEPSYSLSAMGLIVPLLSFYKDNLGIK